MAISLKSLSHPSLCLAACLFSIAPLRADDQVALARRLQNAEQNSSLDIDGNKPWHLKISVQLYDDKGQPTAEQGTIEQWWAGPDQWRIVYDLPTYHATEVRKGSSRFRTSGVDSPPMTAKLLLDQIVHPIRYTDAGEKVTPQFEVQKFGQYSFACIMLVPPMPKASAPAPNGLFPTFCLDPNNDALRVSYNLGSEFITRPSVGTFQSRAVATSVMVSEGVLHTASAKMLTLEIVSPEKVDISSVTGLELLPDKPVVVQATVMKDSVITKITPHYPESAKRRHVSGAVILHAIIGVDGRIHSLQFVSAPDPDLAIAAANAVKQWIYKPYLLNGVAVEVDTTITVNFNFG